MDPEKIAGNQSFFWKIITGNEKFDNTVNKKQWLSPGQTPL